MQVKSGIYQQLIVKNRLNKFFAVPICPRSMVRVHIHVSTIIRCRRIDYTIILHKLIHQSVQTNPDNSRNACIYNIRRKVGIKKKHICSSLKPMLFFIQTLSCIMEGCKYSFSRGEYRTRGYYPFESVSKQ